MAREDRRIWTEPEDCALVRAVEQHGTTSWTTVAECIDDRTGKQCRERWGIHLGKSRSMQTAHAKHTPAA
jgi:hypothetical protein